METVITIWLALAGLYYFGVAILHLAKKLPAVVGFIVLLPAMPFIVAYRDRKEHPARARFIGIG